MEESSEIGLPEAFLVFLKENGVDPSIYRAADSTPRFIRYSNPTIDDKALSSVM